MKKLFTPLLFCLTLLISACGATQSPSPQSSSAEAKSSALHIPPMESRPHIFIDVENTTTMREGLAGTLLALMQSEHGAYGVPTASEADYSIYVYLDKFGQIGSEIEPGSTAQVLLPGLAGAALGTQVGGAFSGKGALLGLGIGLVAGLSLGSMSSSEELLVWQVQAFVRVVDKYGKEYSAVFSPKEKGQNMSADVAAATLENALAWTVVRAFTKD